VALKIIQMAIPDVRIIKPDVFRDSRGFFMETYQLEKYEQLGITRPFVQDNHSRSSKGILRGMHYQLNFPQAKLVSVLRGEIFDVAIDIRRGSPSFGRWVGEVLSEDNNYQIFIPEGFAHGFCVLSDTVDLFYKCTEYFHPEDDRGINWADEAVGITWPQRTALTSDKDSRLPFLENVPPELLPVYQP
jgi:dTDP-4-dehydrorhamnose 3,5-epimerase